MHTLPASFLQRRGQIYWFRKTIPADLVDRVDIQHIRRSLRTDSRRIAQKRAIMLEHELDELFIEIRDALPKWDPRFALGQFLTNLIHDLDRDRRYPETRAMYEFYASSCTHRFKRVPLEEVRIAMQGKKPCFVPDRPAIFDIPPPADAAVVNLAQHEELIRNAVVDALRDQKITAAARAHMTTFVPQYLLYKNKVLKGNKHASEIEAKLDIFIRAIGDKPVFEYTRADAQKFRDLLDKFPSSAIKHLKTDDLEEAIRLNALREAPLPTLSVSTVDAKYLSALKGFFDYLKLEAIVDVNPFDNVRSEQRLDADEAEVMDVEKRLPFTPDQNARLRQISSQKPRDSADYWWHRVMVRTGLRLEEFAQLSVADFRMVHDRICIDLLHTDEMDPLAQIRRKELRMKTNASRRVVPIHPLLIADGILEFVEERRRKDGPLARLFPQATADKFGVVSSALSKRLNRQVNQVVDSIRVVAYSARHTFAAACDASDVPIPVRDRLMGHSSEDNNQNEQKRRRAGTHVGKRYGSPIPSAHEMAWIDRVKFTEGDENAH